MMTLSQSGRNALLGKYTKKKTNTIIRYTANRGRGNHFLVSQKLHPMATAGIAGTK
jgi:hypothetical protein